MKKNIFFITFLIPFLNFAQTINEKIRLTEKEIEKIKILEEEKRDELETLKYTQIRIWLDSIGLPKTLPSEEVLYHSAYAFVYNEEHEQAKWVTHIIMPDIANGNEGRSNDFREDSLVKTKSAQEEDYFLRLSNTENSFLKYEGFGYDRGHLAPSADFRFAKKAISESYFYSNISPQKADLNRGKWAEMEDALRNYAIRNNTPVFVVTGGILKPSLKKIEKSINKVSIPEYFFKVALDLENKRGIGFIMQNAMCDLHLFQYAFSIDSIESLTGIDFFYLLSDSIENSIENNIDVYKWISEKDTGDVMPLSAELLPKNTFNTIQAKIYENQNKSITVCGTVVSAKLSSKGNIFLNLDKQFPNPLFSVSIFSRNTVNFSYQPHIWLMNKTICVKGNITKHNGTPGMVVTNEKNISIIEE
jgi:endonuclease G